MTGVWPLTNLYGSLSLFSGLGVLIYIIFASKYDLWLIGGGVLGISAIAFGYATTWNEGYMPRRARAAVVLDQGSRTDRRVVVRVVHGRVRRVGAVLVQVVRRTPLRSGSR